jgi:hypothetical protein
MVESSSQILALLNQILVERMSTGPVQTVFFPQDGSPPRLVAMTYKLKEVEKEGGPPDMVPSMPVSGEVERLLSIGQPADAPGEQTYHTIAPRMAGIESDQFYCEIALGVYQPS